MKNRGAFMAWGKDIGQLASWLVLLTSIALTYLLWQNAHNASLQERRIEFESRVSDIEERIYRRISYYEQVLHGVRAFYLNQHEMERMEFSGYVANLELARHFPGIQGVSFAPLVTDEDKRKFIAAQRRSGLQSYSILPEGSRPSYAPVAFIEPWNARNERAVGFDNLSNPARRMTIEKARDEDRAVISEKLILMQDGNQAQQAGLLMFLPVFRRGMPHELLEERRTNIAGWFAASFRMNDLMASLLDEHDDGINIEIFDDGEASSKSRMYGDTLPETSLFIATEPIEVAGRKWLVRFSSLPEFDSKRSKSGERNAVIAGIVLGFLLSLSARLLLRDRQRVMQMTQEIGRELEMRKQAEQLSQELHLFNQVILEKSPAGIAVFRESGPCVMANEAYARAIGGSIEEVRQHDFRHNASWQRNGLLDYANEAFKTGLTIRRDISGVTTFGKQVAVECIFAPVGIAGQPHLLLIVNDVSDRVAAEKALTASMRQLEEKELAKTRFLAAAGHDLRQPMAAANLFIDALKMTEATPRQSEIIQRLDQSMSTFNGLLDALLNVSRLDAGMIQPKFSTVSVSEIFNWLEQNFAPMAHDRKLGFRLYFPLKHALSVRSDQGLLQSVLMNLVSNAIKFTATGAVLISARSRGNTVLLQVWDTGVGIAPEHIERIFDEFYQIDNPQRDRSSGLGLGLAIVRRAAALLGTEVRCRSRAGRGSVFELSLPLADGLDRPQAQEPERSSNISHVDFVRGKRFILVEDDALVAQAMLNWLEGMGAEVKCFQNAEEALRHADIDYADYFIADYMLGGALNGIQFLNKVRQKAGRPIRAVLVTGDTSSAFIRHAVECDWPVLHKPINTSQLLTHLVNQGQGLQP